MPPIERHETNKQTNKRTNERTHVMPHLNRAGEKKPQFILIWMQGKFSQYSISQWYESFAISKWAQRCWWYFMCSIQFVTSQIKPNDTNETQLLIQWRSHHTAHNIVLVQYIQAHCFCFVRMDMSIVLNASKLVCIISHHFDHFSLNHLKNSSLSMSLLLSLSLLMWADFESKMTAAQQMS